MKNITLLIPIFAISLLSVSCSPTTSPETQVVGVMQTPTEVAAPTKTPAPTATAAPTETPAPISCNIAFDSDRDGNREIYRMAPDGSEMLNLSNDPGEDIEPSWSADGSRIAFVSNRANDSDGGQFIYVMNADGSNVRQLSREDESKSPDWSPDGVWIAYESKGDIFIIKSDGTSESNNLTNSQEQDVFPKWSPDGSQILWLYGGDGSRNIFTMNTDGSKVRQLSDDGKISDATWTVDGQIFTHWDNQEAQCFNCVMDANGSNIKDGGGKGEIQRYLPFWTLDGDRVECVNANFKTSDNEIYLVGEIYPDNFLNLTNNPADDRNPDWPINCGPNNSVPVEVQGQDTQSQSPEKFVFGYEVSENNLFEQKEADLLKACGELDIKCIKSDSISKLTEQDVDAIISFSNRWHALGSYPVFHDAVTKGILLIVLNAETGEPGAYNLSVESESVKSSLKWMFNEMDGKGELAYFNFGQNDAHQSLIDKALKDFPEIKAIAKPAQFEGDSVSEKSIAALATSNPNLKAIWTDEKLNDVFWGLKNGQVKPVPAILCEARKDMLQFWKDWTNDNPSFRCFSTIKPGGTGYEGIYVAYYILTGEKIDPAALGGESGNTFVYDYPIITNDNLDEWLEKTDSLRKGEWDILEIPPMTPDEIKEKWFLE